jgi:hypothetical protein
VFKLMMIITVACAPMLLALRGPRAGDGGLHAVID